ncbi:tape measure protein [Vibrio phage vB_Va_Val-yong3]|nr:tape measure protein [Vibrio phage vB_Va_Val-yong3]
MSAQIADFNIRFNADSAKFQKDVDYAKKMLRGYTKEAKAANDSTGDFDQQLKVAGSNFKEFGSTSLKVTGMITAGFGAAVTASAYLVRQSAQQAREIERMATVAQVSVEQIQSLSYASEQYNIAGDKMADILKDVNDKLGDYAATGGGEFKDFFEQVAPKVGLTVDELQRMAGPEALIAVKDAMDQANVPMKQQIFYLESIANDASALMPLLENKGERLYELTQRYDDLNVAMSKYDIQQFKQMDQQIADMELKLGRAFSNLSRQVTYSLLPAMDDVNTFVDAMTKGVKDYTNQIEAFGMATATLNVFSGTSMREKHREIFGEMIELQEELKEYEGVDLNKLPSINPFGKSRNEWFNLQRDLGMKRDELKALNDKVVEQQKRWSSNFDYSTLGGNGANDDDGSGGGTKPKNTELERQQAAGASRLSALDMQYASERDKLLLAHDQRLADIDALQLSEQELARRGYDTMESLKTEYKEREKEFYATEQEEFQRKQDEAIQREIDAFTRKEDEKTRKAEQAARQRAATEQRLEQQVLSMKFGLASQGLSLIEQTAKEGSFIQKAAFAAQKAMAAAQVYMQGEVAATAALAPPPIGLGPIAGVGQATAIRALAAASAGLIMGQAIAGMAHDGISEIPAEGTWLLNKGERVYTNYSAKQIDQMYKTIMAMYSKRFAANDPTMAYSQKMVANGNMAIAQPWQIIINEAPPGTSAEIDDEKKIISIMMKDANSGGQYISYISQKLGVKPGGYK